MNSGSHSPAASTQVLNGSSRGFQHGGVLGLLQQGGVDADHLWLVQQLIAFRMEKESGQEEEEGEVWKSKYREQD